MNPDGGTGLVDKDGDAHRYSRWADGGHEVANWWTNGRSSTAVRFTVTPLWEGGDERAAAFTTLTSLDASSSTVHRPYHQPCPSMTISQVESEQL